MKSSLDFETKFEFKFSIFRPWNESLMVIHYYRMLYLFFDLKIWFVKKEIIYFCTVLNLSVISQTKETTLNFNYASIVHYTSA